MRHQIGQEIIFAGTGRVRANGSEVATADGNEPITECDSEETAQELAAQINACKGAWLVPLDGPVIEVAS